MHQPNPYGVSGGATTMGMNDTWVPHTNKPPQLHHSLKRETVLRQIEADDFEAVRSEAALVRQTDNRRVTLGSKPDAEVANHLASPAKIERSDNVQYIHFTDRGLGNRREKAQEAQEERLRAPA